MRFTALLRWSALLLAVSLLPLWWANYRAAAQYAPAPAAVTSVAHPEWSVAATIYEVNLRQYTPQGTFNAFANHLPRLEELGVNILWLMPIHPIGELNRKGTLGSYYSVSDYRAVNPEFGNLADFQQLVARAHERGMHVIIDWVANHSAWDNPLLQEHPEWYTKDDSGRMVSPNPDWTDVADLNYDNAELRAYMTESMKYWVETADIDGFRCDVSGMVPLDFWQEARAELETIKPVFLLAEDEDPAAHAAFDMTYSWSLHGLIIDIGKGRKNANDLAAYFRSDAARYGPEAYRMRFTDNHDENSWNGTMQQRFGAGLPAFVVLTLTAPGMPLVYSGQEAGLDRALAFFEKDPIRWRDDALDSVFTVLLNLKHDHRALWNGASGGPLERIPTSADSAVFAFVRAAGETGRVVTILNLTDHEQRVTLLGTLPTGAYRDVFSGRETALPVSVGLKLEPWGYRVLAEGTP